MLFLWIALAHSPCIRSVACTLEGGNLCAPGPPYRPRPWTRPYLFVFQSARTHLSHSSYCSEEGDTNTPRCPLWPCLRYRTVGLLCRSRICGSRAQLASPLLAPPAPLLFYLSFFYKNIRRFGIYASSSFPRISSVRRSNSSTPFASPRSISLSPLAGTLGLADSSKCSVSAVTACIEFLSLWSFVPEVRFRPSQLSLTPHYSLSMSLCTRFYTLISSRSPSSSFPNICAYCFQYLSVRCKSPRSKNCPTWAFFTFIFFLSLQ